MIPGIDAGNTRFKLAVSDLNGNPKMITNRFGEAYTPSAVFFPTGGEPIVGTEALNAGFAEPDRLVLNWKRDMGTENVLYVSDDATEYTAKAILAILLGNAKTDLEAKTGEVVHEVVITVPANYTEVQKQHTIEAAAQAGMKAFLLPHEPTAAALGNELHKRPNCTALVFDLGGGTFDVSILRTQGNVSKIVATGGDPKLGGRDFNDRICERLLEMFEDKHGFRPCRQDHPVFYQEMQQRVEQAKITLSVQSQTQIVLFCEGKQLQLTLTRQQFNDWVKDLAEKAAERTLQVIQEAGLSVEEVDELYAVGGGSMMPLVKQLLEEATGKRVSQRCEAHCAAALGAVLAGRIECQRQGKNYTCGGDILPPPEFFVHDILSHSIGVLTLDGKDKTVCSEILAKDTPIPSVQTRMYRLGQPNQTAVKIEVLQGPDGAAAAQCLALGHFDLDGLPPRPDLIGRIEISFSLDSNGLLSAKARDTVSGKTAELQIDYKPGDDGQKVDAA